jgi:hypothetical protein
MLLTRNMLEHPFQDGSGRKKYLNDLLDVGPKKPLGYLPLSTIRGHCKVNPEDIAQYLQQKGMEVRLWHESFCRVSSGALYAYDAKALQDLLDKNAPILTEAKWPTAAEQFVNHVATELAPSYTPLFDVVADAFADQNNGLRLRKG